MNVAMTFGGAIIRGPRNATTTISVQSRSSERHLCTRERVVDIVDRRSKSDVKLGGSGAAGVVRYRGSVLL
jgi:hypothetical protein